MKKMMTIGLAAVFAAGYAGAQDDMVMVGQAPANDSAEPLVTAEVATASSYVWRGQVYNNDFVIQPQLTIAQYGVSFNVWANYDLQKNSSGVSSDFSEIDLSLAYELPIDINEMAFNVGVINYNFPNSVGETTSELFASATVLSWQDYVVPSVTLFGDIDEANGTYILFDVMVPYEVSEYFSVAAGVSAGWGNTSYNDYYFNGNQDAGWNDYNFYGNASYEIAENVTASLSMTYTLLEGGSIADEAEEIYDANEKFWVGAGIAYDF